MQKYIDQLVGDLEHVASQNPQAAYIEIPPGMKNFAEIALVPFKPISEWAGLGAEIFPEEWRLSLEQCVQLNKAIFKVFDNLKLKLVDKPDYIPEEWLYEVLRSNWDFPVQYLPSTGMDLEFCSGDWMTCDYGEYCNYCGEKIKANDLNLDI